MRYVFIDKNIALQKGYIKPNCVCITNGTVVVIAEDELSKFGDINTIIAESGAEVYNAKDALKIINQKNWRK